MQGEVDQLRDLLLVFLHPDRLKLIGFLAETEVTRKMIVERFRFGDDALLGDLEILNRHQLLQTRHADGEVHYRLNSRFLISVAVELRSTESQLLDIDPKAFSAEEQEIIQACLDGRRLRIIPGFYRQLSVILRWLVQHFTVGVRYSEQEVNAILSQFNDEVATLRRSLVEHRFMEHENGVYWRFVRKTRQEFGLQLLSGERNLAAEANDMSEQSIFHRYIANKRLKSIPTHKAELRVIAKWIADHFAPEARYPEKEVNTVLARLHEDYATLRRALIDCGFMQRQNGIYWRVAVHS